MEKLLLLILIPPLVGAALNGIFGRRFSRATVSLIGCGAAGLAALFALLAAWTYSHLASEPLPFIQSYFTWIEAGAFPRGLRALLRSLDPGDDPHSDLRRLSDSPLLARLHGARRRLLPFLLLPEPVPLHDAGLGHGRKLPVDVRGLGGRGPLFLPPHRILLPQEVGCRRREKGLRRHAHRRRRIHPRRGLALLEFRVRRLPLYL